MSPAENSLGSRTVSGIFWMIMGSGGQTLFQFALFLVLARALDPLAFGVIAIASAFIDISNYIGRAGLTEVLIQKRSVDALDEDTAFWTSAAFGLVLTIVLFLGADHLAVFFSTPSLSLVMKCLAPASLFYAVGAVYEAKLRRSFGFRQIAARNVSATVVSGLVSMWMALSGYGVYALVAQRIIFVVWQLVAMIAATRWAPTFDFRLSVCATQLGSGMILALSNLLGVGNQRVVDLVVGYFLGPVLLGYLRIAWRGLDLMLEMSIRPITAVTLTSLSRLQDDPKALRDAYVKLVRYTAVFAYPVFAGSVALAPELVRGLFGAKWNASIPLMQIMAATGLFVPLIYYKSNALMATNRMRTVLVLNVVEFVLSTVVAAIMSQSTAEGAAIGNVLRMFLMTPIILFVIQALLEITVARTLAAVWRIAIAAAVMCAVLMGVRAYAFVDLPSYVIAPLLIIAGAILYGAAMAVLERPLVMEIWTMVRNIGQARRASRSAVVVEQTR